ncbi:MAG: hypothetical protein LC667_14450 [Thioalkalivibrio sp.]|nr:hypothetical protein [Thioalkalivibrio sp.]
MSRVLRIPTQIVSGFPIFLARYFGWLVLSGLVTLGGGTVIMLFKEWSLLTILASQLVWPRLMLAMLFAIPIALFPVGRFYFISAILGGFAYHLLLLIL